MSDAYDNVVGGKLKLKGKAALDVKSGSGGIHKHKKKKKHHPPGGDANLLSVVAAGGGGTQLFSSDHHPSHDVDQDDQGRAGDDAGKSTTTAGAGDDGGARWDDHITPAERRYLQQKAKIDRRRLAKTANKSHRDRIQDFNQYLANMSEHYMTSLSRTWLTACSVLLDHLLRLCFFKLNSVYQVSSLLGVLHHTVKCYF